MKMENVNDYFIPLVNGEKAVDIDTIPGMNVETDNDFLDYLRKSMISGMGIPSNYLNYNDEVEFAKSLSMINSKFIRAVILFQKEFGRGFTEIYRKLYKNEYGSVISRKNKSDTFTVEKEAESIEVKLPSPGSLNMNNVSEQIGSTQSVIDYIVNTLLGQDTTDENAERIKMEATKAVAKELIPNIDWTKFERLIEESKKTQVKNELNNPSPEDDMNSSDNLDMGSSGDEGEPEPGDDSMDDSMSSDDEFSSDEDLS